MDQNYWKKCNSCKAEINFSSKYYVCNVSTCNSKRTGLTFCSVPCFERHLPGARHKDAYALEEHSPSKQKYMEAQSGQAEPRRRIITSQTSTASSSGSTASRASAPREILIVASKLKAYVKETSDMNTSADVMNALSNKVRRLCDDAIDKARADGRKTLMDKDF